MNYTPPNAKITKMNQIAEGLYDDLVEHWNNPHTVILGEDWFKPETDPTKIQFFIMNGERYPVKIVPGLVVDWEFDKPASSRP